LWSIIHDVTSAADYEQRLAMSRQHAVRLEKDNAWLRRRMGELEEELGHVRFRLDRAMHALQDAHASLHERCAPARRGFD
jgi:phage shock protein A